MAEQKKPNEQKKNDAVKQNKDSSAAEQPATVSSTSTLSTTQEASTGTPATSSTEEKKSGEEKKPVTKKPLVKKEEAFARGLSLPISKKHAMYLCSFIKNKSVDAALSDLGDVLKFKKAVPYKGEIPHRHGMMSGRYPLNATKAFISMLKGLRGNIIVSGMDIEKARITFASASWASRQRKAGGMRFKRTHVVLKAREIVMKENKEKTEKANKQEKK
jgi:ribosomal protein L22